jgi:hypothetical protein
VAAVAVAAVVADNPDAFNGNLSLLNMKSLSNQSGRSTRMRMRQHSGSRALLLASLLSLAVAVGAADTGKTFSTTNEAVSALLAATTTKDDGALDVLFGPARQDLENPDRVQATNEMNAFTAAFQQAHRLVNESESKCVLEVGPDRWPFPIPLVKKDGGWVFDTEAGKEEILRRRIGKNELSTLEVMRGYVDAQREYASRDRDGDQVLEYAQQITSSPGKTDGLYWPPELNGETSPLGPFFADAQAEGYFAQPRASEAGPQPFHGYLFRILTRQGQHAPGGKYNYVINGNMIGGFALVGWPAEYGTSGVMTFIVNQQGRVYQKDLGERTSKIVRKMHAYDPDPSWQLSPD